MIHLLDDTLQTAKLVHNNSSLNELTVFLTSFSYHVTTASLFIFLVYWNVTLALSQPVFWFGHVISIIEAESQ